LKLTFRSVVLTTAIRSQSSKQDKHCLLTKNARMSHLKYSSGSLAKTTVNFYRVTLLWLNQHNNKQPGTFGRTPRYRLQMLELQRQRTFSPPKQSML